MGHFATLRRMDAAIVMLICGVVGAGVGGGLLSAWGLHRRVFRLELAVTDLQGAQLQTRNKLAAGVRWAKPPDQIDALARQLQGAAQAAPTREVPWWDGL